MKYEIRQSYENIFNKIILILFIMVVFFNKMVHAEESIIEHHDKEFGYLISYPSTWKKRIKPVQSGKLTMFYSTESPKPACQLITTNLSYINSKEYINDYVRNNPLTKKSWHERFKSTADHINVVQNKQTIISGFLSERAILETISKAPGHREFYAKNQIILLNTPGVTWNISCVVMGLSKNEVLMAYKIHEPLFNKIIDSLKITSGK